MRSSRQRGVRAGVVRRCELHARAHGCGPPQAAASSRAALNRQLEGALFAA